MHLAALFTHQEFKVTAFQAPNEEKRRKKPFSYFLAATAHVKKIQA